jgi:hypothetical protein
MSHIDTCIYRSHDSCPASPLINSTPSGSAASNGILETTEKPMHEIIQEELDVLEWVALDVNGAI